MVRAKFRCLEVTKRYSYTDRDGTDFFTFSVKLAPVLASKKHPHHDTPENKAFFAATPSGELEMQGLSEETAARFVPGQAYYLDFTEADG
jgi:hypothetical protein